MTVAFLTLYFQHYLTYLVEIFTIYKKSNFQTTEKKGGKVSSIPELFKILYASLFFFRSDYMLFTLVGTIIKHKETLCYNTSLLRNKRFMLNEITQQNALKFAMSFGNLIFFNFSFCASRYFFSSLMNSLGQSSQSIAFTRKKIKYSTI